MLMNLIWWIVVGLIAGWAAGKIMKGGGYGTVMDIVLGIIGAVVGGVIGLGIGFKVEQGRQLLTHLLAGRLDQLEPVQPIPVEVIDSELDEMQREAVARALARLSGVWPPNWTISPFGFMRSQIFRTSSAVSGSKNR